MKLTVGTWRSQAAFDKWHAKYQYEGTPIWEQVFPVRAPKGIEADHKMISPADLDVELPLSVHVCVVRGDVLVDQAELDEVTKKYPLSSSEEGNCVLCRTSGKINGTEGPVPQRLMFVISCDGERIRQGAFAEKKIVPGVWMPCVCRR